MIRLILALATIACFGVAVFYIWTGVGKASFSGMGIILCTVIAGTVLAFLTIGMED